MPSTASPARGFVVTSDRAERLERMGVAERMRRYERGEHSLADLSVWAARYPEEAPLVNGEFAWIGLTLADLD